MYLKQPASNAEEPAKAFIIAAKNAKTSTPWRPGKRVNWTAIGSLFLMMAVGLGAFGAHGLKDRLSDYAMTIYEKAVLYHFIHALGLLLVALMAKTSTVSAAAANRTGWLLSVGIVLFSGSLYALAISGVKVLGAVTPLGGLAFIAAWIVLFIEAAFRT